MKLTPTVAEVKLFGKEIGIENIPIFDGYEEWWNVLHEIGHYAVKSDAYIQLWQKHNKKERGVPSLNWFDSSYDKWMQEHWNYDLLDDESDDPLNDDIDDLLDDRLHNADSTPGEAEVVLWCLLVLKTKNWINPKRCTTWRLDIKAHNRVDRQWQPPKDKELQQAFNQLKAVGIYPNSGKFRPTKIPAVVEILIMLGELEASYATDFRVKETLDNACQIQLQHQQIAESLRLRNANPQKWERWIEAGILTY
ncbi:hypothetical protein [Nostoc cycadae]|nr:hypothetical protein [Nostoc cycadae]